MSSDFLLEPRIRARSGNKSPKLRHETMKAAARNRRIAHVVDILHYRLLMSDVNNEAERSLPQQNMELSAFCIENHCCPRRHLTLRYQRGYRLNKIALHGPFQLTRAVFEARAQIEQLVAAGYGALQPE